jgi:phospholipid/cholesterol/gamma-HCH transport system ATP-binding protein
VLQDARIGYEAETPLFSGLNLKIDKGAHTALAGSCGVGKSAIVKTVMGLLNLWGGSFYAFGRDMANPSAALLSYVRKKIGLLPDRGILLQNLTVFENIALPLRFGQFQPREKIYHSVEPFLKEFRLEGIVDEYPSTLNLDQIKKVGFVRAIINNPDLLILDDPFEGLDDKGIQTIREFLFRTNLSGESTILIFSRKSWDYPPFFTNRYQVTPDGVVENQ